MCVFFSLCFVCVRVRLGVCPVASQRPGCEGWPLGKRTLRQASGADASGHLGGSEK